MQNVIADARMQDLSGNCFHGTITGMQDVPGKVGRAREFNGTSDQVTSSFVVSGLADWTIALWVKWSDGPNTYEHPIGLGVGHDATFWFRGTTVAFKTTDADGNTVVDRVLSNGITHGTWYHLAATFDGTTVQAYLNGIEAFSINGPTTTIRSKSVRIGTSGGEFANFFNGTIDEVLLYARSLNASEIEGLTLDVPLIPHDPPQQVDIGRAFTGRRPPSEVSILVLSTQSGGVDLDQLRGKTVARLLPVGRSAQSSRSVECVSAEAVVALNG